MTGTGLKTLDATSLDSLLLRDAAINDEGLKAIASLNGSKLTQIAVENNAAITDKGLAHLAGLEKLRSLSLGKSKTTEAGRAALKASIPKLTITAN